VFGAKAKRAEAQRKAIAEAQKIVAIWNARHAEGRALRFYPTIGAAIAAGVPWLTISCPACGQVGSVDLRTLVPTVLAERAVRGAGNADGRAAVMR
jgi:hypothetical protein